MANCHNCERLVICPWANPEEIICSSFKAKPMTNGDRIRSMSDEELAEWLATVPMSYEDVCPNPIPKECNGGDRETCIQCWLDWLRQEVQDG